MHSSYARTIVTNRPRQYRYPVIVSAVVWVSGILYAAFVRERDEGMFRISLCVYQGGTLTLYAPRLSGLKNHVAMLFCTRAAKIPLLPQATVMHPLAIRWEERDSHH